MLLFLNGNNRESKKFLHSPLDWVEVNGEDYVGFDELDFEQLLPFWSSEYCFNILDSLVGKNVLKKEKWRKDFFRFNCDFVKKIKNIL